MYMIKARIKKAKSTTLDRVMSGFSLEIRDKVEILSYQDLNDLVYLCIKVEQQNLRKISNKRENLYSNSYNKKDHKREGDYSKK